MTTKKTPNQLVVGDVTVRVRYAYLISYNDFQFLPNQKGHRVDLVLRSSRLALQTLKYIEDEPEVYGLIEFREVVCNL